MKTTATPAFDMEAAIQSNDPVQRNRALKALYNNPVIERKIIGWAKVFGLKKADPDDILQEAIIKLDVLIRNGSFKGNSSVVTFLLGICKNLIRDSTRTPGKVSLKAEFTDADLSNEDAVADAIIVQEETELEQKRDELLNQSLNSMKENCREALKMYYFEMKNMAQIAETRTLANADQAKKAVYRCRQQLRELLEENPTLIQIIHQTL